MASTAEWRELRAQLVGVREELSAMHRARDAAEEALANALDRVGERELSMGLAEELAQVGHWTWWVGSAPVEWSVQVHRIFGTDPEAPPPDFERFAAMLHPGDRDRVLELIQRAVSSGAPFEVEHRIVRDHGDVRVVWSRGQAELNAVGQPVKLAGSIQDVTERRAATQAVKRSRDLFAGVLGAATEQSIIATDPQGLITVFNTGAERMLGYTEAEMLGTSPERLHDPAEIAARAAELGTAPGFGVFLVRAAQGQPETRRWTYLTRDGRRLQAMITVNAIRADNGEVTGYIKVGTDVTDQLAAQSALADSEERFRDTFEHAPIGMMLVSVSRSTAGRFLQVNPALCDLTGYTQVQLLGMSAEDLVHPDQLALTRGRLAALRDSRPTDTEGERHWVHADGTDLWIQFNHSPRRDKDEPYVVVQVVDITARRLAEDRLTQQALHDWLTGLPNRLLLMDRIEHALIACRRSGRLLALMYLDLDGFKYVNDTGGHAVGDRVLVEVADRLRRVIRPEDTVARLGGDEFVVVCENLHHADEAPAIAERILNELRVPHVHGAQQFSVRASIGIALGDSDSHPDELLRAADAAMYSGKHAGKDRVQVSGADSPTADAAARATRALRVENELRSALANGEFVLFGQSTHDLTTGRIPAVESLLRWQHPERGLLGPADFLDVAEASDLMIPIGRWVLDESCRMATEWVQTLGDAAPAVHVNISGRQLEAGDLSTDVRQALHRHRLAPGQLVLELTETHMPLLADSLRQDVIALREYGVRVAIDDLGTGYSSLTRITQLPVDILKIDRSFVAGMDQDPTCAAVVRGVLAIGQALDLDVVAEGVETVGQADQLLEYGCTTVQGYLYSRPLPEAELLAHLKGSR